MVMAKTSNHEITIAWLTEKSIDASLSTTHLETGVDLVYINLTELGFSPPQATPFERQW